MATLSLIRKKVQAHVRLHYSNRSHPKQTLPFPVILKRLQVCKATGPQKRSLKVHAPTPPPQKVTGEWSSQESSPQLAWLGAGCCIYTSNLNQKFGINTASKAPPVCCTSKTPALCSGSRWRTMECELCPSPTPKLSWKQLTLVPGQTGVNAPTRTQPRLFASVKGHSGYK